MRKIFPVDLPASEWVQFEAEGFTIPVTGVIYRMAKGTTCGMPLGGLDTGCLDLETSGLLGYCSIFNSLAPRRGPLNLPFLGVSVGGQTWVLCDPSQVKSYDVRRAESLAFDLLPEPLPPLEKLELEGVKTAKEITYWGHYPVADLEFEIDGPLSIGLRAWSPFLPGDVEASMTPAILFEVRLRNLTAGKQRGTVAFSFPGPSLEELGGHTFSRREVRSLLRAVLVQSSRASYTLGVIGEKRLRLGGELGGNGAAWAKIEAELPNQLNPNPDAIPGVVFAHEGSGASAAVDFILEPEEEKVVRFILAWHSPEWKGGGSPQSDRGSWFTHMYARHYPSAVHAALKLVEERHGWLERILAWQQEVYSEESLPPWLRDVLVNNFHLITEIGIWAQARPPIGDWCHPIDGLWALNESPRSCPGMECGGNSYYAGVPVHYFFPQLFKSKLRADKAYQFADGCPAWIYGGITEGTPFYELTTPVRGYQTGQTGSFYVGMVFRQWKRTGDDEFLREFYCSLKKATEFIFTVNPDQPYGLLSLPEFDLQESYESTPFKGISSHVASIRLYHLKAMEKMAEHLGDTAFERQCRKWFEQAARIIEEHLWEGSYYLQHKDVRSGDESRAVMGYQLDGEFMAYHDGLGRGVFPPERVGTVLDTLCRTALDAWGARVWSSPEGGPVKPGEFQTGYWSPNGVHAPGALMLAMVYMYHGHKEIGINLARRIMENMICRQGWTWDMPVLYQADTGEGIYGTDYNQMMMCWALPAAVEGKDMAALASPGGFVDRLLKAARGQAV